MASVPDTLRSKDKLEAVLGICEGPIFGLENGNKSFFIGDTQLQNDDDSDNFDTFTLEMYPGNDVADPVILTLGGTSNNHAVNVALGTDVPVVRTTQTPFVDFLDVRIAINRLTENKTSGAKATSVVFRIEYKPSSSGTYVKAFGQDLTISGKTLSVYAKDFRIAVPSIDDTYDIRVTKISPINTATVFRDITWEGYQEIIADPKSYNNTACIRLLITASEQLSSIPNLSGIYKGRLIKLPSNYNPLTREYTGAWDGSWQVAWSDNPAWILYDFVMNDRFGIKAYYTDIVLDKYDVYEAGQWCDEMVPDGEGGEQPRYTFNLLITEARPGKELARYIAGAFNSTFFDDLNGTAFLRVDKDDDAVQMFTQENVLNGSFDYGYTDLTSRYNDITVTFTNPDLNWAEDRRRVSFPDKIERFGRIPLDFVAVGCTDPHEAVRRAQYKLITANTEIRLVKFQTNRVGLYVQPFDVILIADPDMGYGLTGRVKTINEDMDVITLRDPLYLETGFLYDIFVQLNDGTEHQSTLSVVGTGDTFTLSLADPIPDDKLPEQAVFRLEQTDRIGAPRPFRVTKIEEVEGNPDAIKIEAISINRNKWYDSDNVEFNGEIEYSVLPSPFNVPGPTSCTFDEQYIPDLKEFQITVSPYFNRRTYPYYDIDQRFEVHSRLNGTTDPFEIQTLRHGDTLINHPPGLYDFKIFGISSLGVRTKLENAPVYQFEVTNPLTPPKDIDFAKINKREVYWGYSDPPEDFAGFVVRYHNIANKITFDDALQPHTGILTATQFYTNLIPPSARTILVKAVDAFGVFCLNPAVIYRDVNVVAVATNQVHKYEFHATSPPWIGEKIGCEVDIMDGKLKATATGTFYSGTPTARMYHDDGSELLYDAVYDEFIYIANFDVTHAGDLIVNAVYDASGYEVSLREATSPPGAWFLAADTPALDVGSYDVKIRIFGGPVQGVLHSLTLIVDAEDQHEYVTSLEILAAGTRIPIQKTYSEIKIVSVNIEDDGSSTAVGYRILDYDTTVGAGPLVELLDGTGTPVDGHASIEIRGFV